MVQLGAARPVPRHYALFANFPNPVNPVTSIEYALPEAAQVELVVYDLLGQKVRTLVVAQQQSAGYYRLRWDGRDSMGRAMASGVYLYRLVTPEFVQTRKMTIIN